MVILKAVVNHECCKGLDAVVEFVFPELIAILFHHSMQPESMLSTVPVSVVVDNPESVSQFSSINLRIQSISGRAEDCEFWAIGASVLLRSQVLIKLSRSKFLKTV